MAAVTGSATDTSCAVADVPEVSSAIVEENWNEDVLDMTTDISPFGNCQ